MAQLLVRYSHPARLDASRRVLATVAKKGSLKRDVRFGAVTEQHVHYFTKLLGDAAVVTNAADLQPFNVDWMRRFVGKSRLALKPRTTAHVSSIMRYCSQHQLAVVPQGGNTGLVGGSVPVFDEIVLCLSAMDKIEALDASSGVVVAQAGVILEALDNHVAEAGLRVPLDLGAKGSCHIGGNVATNAGGSRFVRYGPLRASVLGLEAVLPDGRVFDNLTTLRKDNTGYDLKQLLIGSEGTLGVITRIALACPVRSPAVDAVILRIDSFERVLPLLRLARRNLAEVLSAFEYIDDTCVRMATTHLTHVINPLPEEDGDSVSSDSGGGLILIECAGSNADHNRQKLDVFLEAAFEEEVVSNGVIAENETQTAALWELRESLPEAVLKAGSGGTLKYDVSLPLEAFNECIQESRKRLSGFNGVTVAGFGHVADGNLHLNVSIADSSTSGDVGSRMEPWLYEFIQGHGGSISAEHGLGVMKAGAIGYSKGDVAIDMMRGIKKLVDPLGICNPYKVFPPPS